MKKLLRLTLTVGLLSSLTISQLPEIAKCQMAAGGIFAMNCRMACCKTKLPTSNCPMLKVTAPRDFIATASPIFQVGLHPIHTMGAFVQSEVLVISAVVYELTQTFELLFRGPAQSVRAPPQEVVLLAA